MISLIITKNLKNEILIMLINKLTTLIIKTIKLTIENVFI